MALIEDSGPVKVVERVVEPPISQVEARINEAVLPLPGKKSYTGRDYDAEARGKCLFGYLNAAISSPAGAAFNMDKDLWWAWCVETAHKAMKVSFPDYQP